MARELPIISPGNVITYDLGDCCYISAVLEVSGINSSGYLDVTIYDISTPDPALFTRATPDRPVTLSINPLVSNLTVHDYNDYLQQHPELFI